MLSNETHLFAHCEVTGADVIVILETIPNIVAGIAARQGWYPEILMFVFILRQNFTFGIIQKAAT